MGEPGKIITLQNSEPVVFINECLPQLIAGNYTVTADLTVQGNAFDQVSKDFYVGAPRFVLDDSDIYLRCPQIEATGHYETTLPNIMLNRRTLPWERTIDGQPATTTEFQNPQGHAPWMGLLLLSEDEIKGFGIEANAIKPAVKSLNDIFVNNKENVFVPEIKPFDEAKPKALLALDPWEKTDNTCRVIDVPLELFKTIAPAKNDLPYLAHVRQVKVDGNKEKADIDDDGYFSTLVCNRLPVRDINKPMRNTVFVVSLEGFHNYFKNPASITKPTVRLVVLTSWSFTVSSGKNFKELCQGLRVTPFKMNSPSGTDESLRKVYDYGYTLLPHTTRDGANTFSWYRGPFNPNFLPVSPKTRKFENADEALRFDHETGLFDISYSAAWQLGRLLALKDKVFSTALHQWKFRAKRKVLQDAALQQINKLFPDDYIPSPSVNSNSLEDRMKDFFGQKYAPEGAAKLDPKPMSADPDSIKKQFDSLAEKKENLPDIPAEVKDWLGKLFLFNGVPLNYLVPHENYLVSRGTNNALAKEALGTFYIDYDWVEALLGGALSIVSSEDSVPLLNMLKDGKFLPENLTINKNNSDFVPAGDKKEVPMPPGIRDHVTGFFMRSELVSGWKGIKIFTKGKTDSSDKEDNWMRHPLRIERIAGDIQLCIFSGKVQEIVIIQPPEGIHFGMDTGESDGTFVKKLRNFDDGNIDKAATIGVSFRNAGKRVLDFSTIVGNMAKKKNRAVGISDLYSSADLAFQLMEEPIMYSLKINDK